MANGSSADMLFARIGDMCRLARKRKAPVFSAFLNECEQYEAARIIKTAGDMYFSFYGGYEHCIRRILCVSDYEDDIPAYGEFPVHAVSFICRKTDLLGHRDVLGAVMAVGITREQVGDIFTGDGAAVAFCTASAKEAIMRDITSVGRVGVSLADGIAAAASGVLHPPVFEDMALSVSSMRCDCIVSAVTGLSRGVSEEYIRSGKLMINYLECTDKSRTVCGGDILTLRGYGKYIVGEGAGTTKRGRLRLNIRKYAQI